MKNIRDILVATDLSETSDVVVRAAAALAALTGGRLHVLHVYEFQSSPQMTSLVAPTFDDRITELQQAVREQVERTVRGGVEVVSTEIIIFTAYRGILDHAHTVAADLIVIGRHRGGDSSGAFLGSTADNVVRSAGVPVMIVHDPLRAPLRRVVVPIDLSAHALHALDVAMRWVASLGPADSLPEMIALHVLPASVQFTARAIDDAAIAARLQAEVAAVQARAGLHADLNVRTDVRWADDTADEIVRYIDTEQVDMAVLGTHGYGMLERALLGSVSSAVARSAGCPILLVPPDGGTVD
jgi:nucleotide-binding universal stress UspA family protein